jgi:hypothetical protein
VRAAGITTIPVDLAKYAVAANAEIRFSDRLAPGAAGNTLFALGRHIITINAKDAPERQRFTALHEIGHIVLELPSQHTGNATSEQLHSYVRRPLEEVRCDTFAAECLLPHEFLRQDLAHADAAASLEFVEKLAAKYQASLPCTASRAVVGASFPCAYVLSQEGFVRYACYSQSMRATKFWVTLGVAVPQASATGQCIKDGSARVLRTVPAHIWTSSDGFDDLDLMEEARVLNTWGQGVTLLFFDDGDVPQATRPGRSENGDEDEPLLRELDGQLPWPSGKKRR